MRIAKLVHYKVTSVFVTFMVLSTILSMFIDSITVILFLAAVTIELSQLLKFTPIPMILAEIFCANLGGSATMCGDPPNIIIGTSLGYSFSDFVTNTGVIAAVSFVAVMIYFYIVFRKDLLSNADTYIDISTLPSPESAITNKIPRLSRTVRGISSSLEENVAYLQFDYLRKKAEKGDSFVIVGRCSEEILRDYKGLISLYILGDMDCKIDRIMDRYQLSKKDALKMIRDKDKERQRYHNSFCKGKWADSSNYDISINSSKTGIDGAVKFLINYIELRRKRML